jgi:hypothetical protein
MFAMKKNASGSTETLLLIFQSTRWRNPVDLNKDIMFQNQNSKNGIRGTSAVDDNKFRN